MEMQKSLNMRKTTIMSSKPPVIRIIGGLCRKVYYFELSDQIIPNIFRYQTARKYGIEALTSAAAAPWVSLGDKRHSTMSRSMCVRELTKRSAGENQEHTSIS